MLQKTGLTTIDKLIIEIEATKVELEELEAALAVCRRIEGEPAPRQPLFRVTKAVTDTPSQVTPQARVKPVRVKPVPMIVKLLKIQGPLKADKIVRDTGLRQRTVWNALTRMKNKGAIERGNDGRYALTS